MEFFISAISDIGISRKVNQDALFAAKMKTATGNLAFAVMSDGMGGFSQGEIASTSVVAAFKEWYHKRLPLLSSSVIEDLTIIDQWTSVVRDVNDRIRKHGEKNKCRLGSTVTVLLLSESRYYLMNIGDTRAYLFKNGVSQLTVDHTLVEQQIRQGILTREQAESSSIRSVITRCVGVTEEVYPDFFFGVIEEQAVYLLCTDGFRHKLKDHEMHMHMSSRDPKKCEELQQALFELVETNKRRKEKDNISVLAVSNKMPDLSEEYDEEDDQEDDTTVQLPDESDGGEKVDFNFVEEITLVHSNIIL